MTFSLGVWNGEKQDLPFKFAELSSKRARGGRKLWLAGCPLESQLSYRMEVKHDGPMTSQTQFPIATVLEVFTEEITARSGVVRDTVQDGTRLFTRSILPDVQEVRPDDRLQGGVALRATASEIWLHPYVFRTVCSNGAIMAHALHPQHLTDLNLRDPQEAETAFREAIQACCAAEAFRISIHEFRSATEVQADWALSLLPLLSRFGSQIRSALLSQIMDQFFREADRTRFSLTNAVTAVARHVPEPPSQTALEVLGDLAGTLDEKTANALLKAVKASRKGPAATVDALRNPWAS